LSQSLPSEAPAQRSTAQFQMAAVRFSALPVEEESLEAYMDNLSMIHLEAHDDGIRPFAGDAHGSHDSRRWRILGAVALMGCGLAVAVLAFSAPTKTNALTVDLREANAAQAKYSEVGDFWQAPGKRIIGLLLWGSCGTNMVACDGHCCCKHGHYWRTQPRTTGRFSTKACVPKAEVPTHVVSALASADGIGSSDTWG